MAFPYQALSLVHTFLPPEGEVLVCLGGTLLRQVLNLLKFDDLHGHIIYQNDPMAKPDFMVMVPDLYCRRRRRQARRRLYSLPPEPQWGGLKLA